MEPAVTCNRLRDMAHDYDALLCDAWGVIHDGVRLFPGAAEAMIRFREARGPVIILTNAPRPSSVIPDQLDALGLSRDAYDGVVTSGDAVHSEIASRLPLRPYHLGPERDTALFAGMDISFAPPEEAGFIICTGLFDDRHENPEDYRQILADLAFRRLEMICVNPDIVVNRGGRRIWCAGALARLYSELGGPVVYGGKPYAPIYRLALDAVRAAGMQDIDIRRVLAAGDGVETDIAGAAAWNIDAVFITGSGGIGDVPSGNRPSCTGVSRKGSSLVVRMESLRW